MTTAVAHPRGSEVRSRGPPPGGALRTQHRVLPRAQVLRDDLERVVVASEVVPARPDVHDERLDGNVRVVLYERTSGWSSKASGGVVERRRGVSGLKARGGRRRETMAKVLEKRRAPRERGRMGTSGPTRRRASTAGDVRADGVERRQTESVERRHRVER
eukprot:31028-Pelagococcus_subviridis.AAC.10